MKIIQMLKTDQEKVYPRSRRKTISITYTFLILLKNPYAYVFSTVGYAEFEYVFSHRHGGLRQFQTLINTKKWKNFQGILVVNTSMSYVIISTTYCDLIQPI